MKALFGIVVNEEIYENCDLAMIRMNYYNHIIEYILNNGEVFQQKFDSDNVRFLLKDLKTREEFLATVSDIHNFTKAQLFGKIFSKKNEWGLFMATLVMVNDIIFDWYKYLDFRSITLEEDNDKHEPYISLYKVCTDMNSIQDIELNSDYLYLKCDEYTLKCKRNKGFTDNDLLLFLTKLRIINTMRYIGVAITGLS